MKTILADDSYFYASTVKGYENMKYESEEVCNEAYCIHSDDANKVESEQEWWDR